MSKTKITPKERVRRDLLRVLDARPDVTVLLRTWPVTFVHLRHVNHRWTMNGDGFNPQHREAALLYGQTFQATTIDGAKGVSICPIPPECTKQMAYGPLLETIRMSIGDLPQPEVEAALGLRPAVPVKEPLSLQR